MSAPKLPWEARPHKHYVGVWVIVDDDGIEIAEVSAPHLGEGSTEEIARLMADAWKLSFLE